MGSIVRDQIAHFLSDELETVYNRLGKGLEDFSSSANPQTTEKTYIDGTNSNVTSAFKPTWPVSGDVYEKDPVNVMLFDMAVKQVKGSDAIRTMLTCYLWRPHENDPNTFEGWKQKVSWVPDNDGGGAGTDTAVFSGSLNGNGERVFGWVTVTKSTDPTNDLLPDTATFSVDPPVAP